MLEIGINTETPVVKEKVRRTTDIKTTDIYDYYDDNDLGEKIDPRLFLSIIRDYNKYFIEKVLQGERLKFYSGLGELMVIEVKRKDYIVHGKTGDILPNTRAVDWGTTRKLNIRNEEGKLVRQFFRSGEQPYYCKIHWMRNFANSPNIRFYKFKPSMRLRKALPAHIKTNELVYLKYRENRSVLRDLARKDALMK